MVSGIVYTLAGLCLFLAAVNTGFLPVGYALGGQLAALPANWVLVPLAMLMGFFIVRAEPAVHVLNEQVSQITDGVIGKRAMLYTLSLGVAASLGLAMVAGAHGAFHLVFRAARLRAGTGHVVFCPQSVHGHCL